MSENNSQEQNAVNHEVASAALAKAVSLHLDGKFAEALQEINGALATGTGTPRLYSAKAHIQYELQQYEEAARSYQKVLNLDPAYPGAQLNQALSLEKSGKWAEAAEAFTKALQLEPNRPEAMVGAAIASGRFGSS